MRTLTRALVAPVLLALAASAGAQGIGSSLPEANLHDFTQTPATSFEDFTGRLVLLEFFAHW